MADITFTPANVVAPDSASLKVATVGAGVTVAAGDLIRKVGDEAFLSECDASVVEAVVLGMAMEAGTVGQLVAYAPPGTLIEMGANSATVGQNLTLSNNAGKFGPESDRLSTEFTTTIGTMASPTILNFSPASYGVARA